MPDPLNPRNRLVGIIQGAGGFWYEVSEIEASPGKHQNVLRAPWITHLPQAEKMLDILGRELEVGQRWRRQALAGPHFPSIILSNSALAYRSRLFH